MRQSEKSQNQRRMLVLRQTLVSGPLRMKTWSERTRSLTGLGSDEKLAAISWSLLRFSSREMALLTSVACFSRIARRFSVWM